MAHRDPCWGMHGLGPRRRRPSPIRYPWAPGPPLRPNGVPRRPGIAWDGSRCKPPSRVPGQGGRRRVDSRGNLVHEDLQVRPRSGPRGPDSHGGRHRPHGSVDFARDRAATRRPPRPAPPPALETSACPGDPLLASRPLRDGFARYAPGGRLGEDAFWALLEDALILELVPEQTCEVVLTVARASHLGVEGQREHLDWEGFVTALRLLAEVGQADLGQIVERVEDLCPWPKEELEVSEWAQFCSAVVKPEELPEQAWGEAWQGWTADQRKNAASVGAPTKYGASRAPPRLPPSVNTPCSATALSVAFLPLSHGALRGQTQEERMLEARVEPAPVAVAEDWEPGAEVTEAWRRIAALEEEAKRGSFTVPLAAGVFDSVMQHATKQAQLTEKRREQAKAAQASRRVRELQQLEASAMQRCARAKQELQQVESAVDLAAGVRLAEQQSAGQGLKAEACRDELARESAQVRALRAELQEELSLRAEVKILKKVAELAATDPEPPRPTPPMTPRPEPGPSLAEYDAAMRCLAGCEAEVREYEHAASRLYGSEQHEAEVRYAPRAGVLRPAPSAPQLRAALDDGQRQAVALRELRAELQAQERAAGQLKAELAAAQQVNSEPRAAL